MKEQIGVDLFYDHFSITELARGVFAAIHKEGGSAYSNAGIVDLGDHLLVFDTFDRASAAQELASACKTLTGRSPDLVVNSHAHGDHWGGNQVFAPGAILLGTHQTRADMLEWGAELEELKSDPHELEADIQDMEARSRVEQDPIRLSALERSLRRDRALLADLPDFRFCPPAMTFSGTLTLRGTERSLDLWTTGPAHTVEDCYLVLKEEKIVFTGDLAFFECPPFITANGSLDRWLEVLDEFQQSQFLRFIPGHGPVGDRSNLKRHQQYLLTMRRLVADAIQAGRTRPEVLCLPLPQAFEDWASLINRNENNLGALYDMLIGK